MKPEFNKISDYLISYYKITDETPFLIKEIEPTDLLLPSRFDLGAKLYYIDSYVKKKNHVLAAALYDNHIAAFQDGIIEEHGNREKKGFETYHSVLEELVNRFLSNEYNSQEKLIPVDKNMCLLDGAHRAACSIYFNKKISVIIFPTIEGYNYDREFFYKRGLEQGYSDIMEYILYSYGTDISGRFSNVDEARALLKIDQKEQVQKIEISAKEKRRCKRIRFFRNRYTRMVIWIKKRLGLPV